MVGQVLRVPGDTQPYVPEVECVPWEVLTPFNGSMTVPADGTITFNWRGPAAPINLIRIYRPDGSNYEVVIELRQNETINLNDFLSQAGTYTWYVYPLDAISGRLAAWKAVPGRSPSRSPRRPRRRLMPARAAGLGRRDFTLIASPQHGSSRDSASPPKSPSPAELERGTCRTSSPLHFEWRGGRGVRPAGKKHWIYLFAAPLKIWDGSC